MKRRDVFLSGTAALGAGLLSHDAATTESNPEDYIYRWSHSFVYRDHIGATTYVVTANYASYLAVFRVRIFIVPDENTKRVPVLTFDLNEQLPPTITLLHELVKLSSAEYKRHDKFINCVNDGIRNIYQINNKIFDVKCATYHARLASSNNSTLRSIYKENLV